MGGGGGVSLLEPASSGQSMNYSFSHVRVGFTREREVAAWSKCGACNKRTLPVEIENTRVMVNWMNAALKVTARYIPAATQCLILIKQQMTKITHCS